MRRYAHSVLRLYHGSNVLVTHPVLLPAQRTLDFGPGFYVTSSLEQAQRWARLKSHRLDAGTPSVSVFEWDDSDPADLLIIRFDQADAAWLEFVAAHRRDQWTGQPFDLAIGPVADDITMPVLQRYLSGVYSAEEALRRLLPMRLADQYAFATQQALDQLRYAGEA
jgi:hypothetical protein